MYTYKIYENFANAIGFTSITTYSRNMLKDLVYILSFFVAESSGK